MCPQGSSLASFGHPCRSQLRWNQGIEILTYIGQAQLWVLQQWLGFRTATSEETSAAHSNPSQWCTAEKVLSRTTCSWQQGMTPDPSMPCAWAVGKEGDA